MSASTFNLAVVPAAAEVVKNQTLTFAARGVSSGASVDVSPTWSVSDSSIAELNTLVGPSVLLTAKALGDVVLTATSDGMTTTVPVAIVTRKSSANTFDVYKDSLPSGSDVDSDIFVSPGLTLSTISTGYAPDGEKYQRATSAPNDSFWGVTLDKYSQGKKKNLSDFSNGSLKFALRLARVLAANETFRIDITNASGGTRSVLLDTTHGLMRSSVEWQEISIPISSFALPSFEIRVPFAISPQTQSSITHDVDAIRWEK